MQFSPTEEQLAVQRTAREFATTEVLPKAAEIDREHRHPTELVKRMAELGFLGIAVPEAHGGAGLDHISYVLAMEEISRACASTGVIMSVNNSLVCDPLVRFATEAQKQQWLVPLAQGKLLGCFALSEPEAGSDAAAQRTTAVRDGSDWVISGTKNWITNGPMADVCVLFTMNDRAAGHKGKTKAAAGALLDEARALLGSVATRESFSQQIDPAAARSLHDRARDFQNEFQNQQWGPVRIIHCWPLLLVEEGLALHVSRAVTPSDGYKLAADWAQHYDPSWGNGLNGPSRGKLQELARFMFNVEAIEEEG